MKIKPVVITTFALCCLVSMFVGISIWHPSKTIELLQSNGFIKWAVFIVFIACSFFSMCLSGMLPWLMNNEKDQDEMNSEKERYKKATEEFAKNIKTNSI